MATLTPTRSRSAGVLAQLRGFDRAFWSANTLEFVERWAYVGVRAVLSLYLVAAVGQGGLQFTHIQKGAIYSWWALIISLLPMFLGGLADRFGYKRTVAISVVAKIAGYLLMATRHDYPGFFWGCMALALGTALFKPAVRGIAASSGIGHAPALGWGLFYAMVSLGGFVGPWLAGYLRMLSWSHVFYANAGVVALNLLVLLAFEEPPRPVPAAPMRGPKELLGLAKTTVVHLMRPRVFGFLAVFSAYWLMAMQLLDLLPNFIDDWVDSSQVLVLVGRVCGNETMLQQGLAGAQVPPEWLFNLDAGVILLLMIPLSHWLGGWKPIKSIVWGIPVTLLGFVAASSTSNGLWCLLGILVFAIGKIMTSPRKYEYLASLAPPNMRGLYMGFSDAPLAIGWGLGSRIGGWLYETYADKVNLARHYLVTVLHRPAAEVQALPKDQVVSTLAAALHQSPREVTELLFVLHHPERIWGFFAAVGVASWLGMVVFERLDRRGSESR